MAAPDAAVTHRAEDNQYPVAVICGGGAMPFAVADALGNRGRTVVLFAIEHFADQQRVAEYPHHWISLRRPGHLPSLMRSAGCREAVFVGHLVRPRFRDVGLDWTTIRLLPRIYAAFRGGDDHLLSGIGNMFEESGFRMVGPHEVAPEILVPRGLSGSVGRRIVTGPTSNAPSRCSMPSVHSMSDRPLWWPTTTSDGRRVEGPI